MNVTVYHYKVVKLVIIVFVLKIIQEDASTDNYKLCVFIEFFAIDEYYMT